QITLLADRIEVGQGRVPARAIDDIGRRRRHALDIVRVIEVIDTRDAGPGSRLDEAGLEGRHLLVAGDAHPQGLLRALEGRGDVRPGPAVVPQLGPAVVIAPVAEQRHTAVVRRAAADDAGAVVGGRPDLTGVVRAAVAPVVRTGDAAGVEQLRRPAPLSERAIVRP